MRSWNFCCVLEIVKLKEVAFENKEVKQTVMGWTQICRETISCIRNTFKYFI